MGDFGIKVSQPGKDVQDSGDQDMLFSSAWPTPKLIFQGQFNTIQLGTNFETFQLIEHNLNYVPMFLDFIIQDGTYTIGASSLSADTKFIYHGQNIFSKDYNVGVLIFDVDITKNFKADNINTGTSSNTGVDRDFGIKLSKKNKDASSDDLRDFLIHSSTRSPLLHAVSHGPANAPGAVASLRNYEYEHDLPYNPMFLAYLKPENSDRYSLINNISGLVTGVNAFNNVIEVVGMDDGDSLASIITLKDPFQIDTEFKV